MKSDLQTGTENGFPGGEKYLDDQRRVVLYAVRSPIRFRHENQRAMANYRESKAANDFVW
jgi:hypothetical protein